MTNSVKRRENQDALPICPFAVFQASTLPMSIIIVGIGDADFDGKLCIDLSFI